MPYDILKARDGDAVVLVETGYGRALGPVLSGPDAEPVMEAFIAGLGVDPAIIPAWILEQRFHEFLTALNQDDETAEPAGAEAGEPGEAVVPTTGATAPSSADVPAPTPAGASTDGSAAGGVAEVPPVPEAGSGSSTAPPAAGAATSAEVGPQAGPDEPEPAVDPSEVAAGEATRATVPTGKVTCPQCDGWGTIAKDGQVVQCPLCEGTGSVTPDVRDAYLREQAG